MILYFLIFFIKKRSYVIFGSTLNYVIWEILYKRALATAKGTFHYFQKGQNVFC